MDKNKNVQNRFYTNYLFFPCFFRKIQKRFSKIFGIRCIHGNKCVYLKKVDFFTKFGGRSFLDIYLDIFQLCQNGVFSRSFWTLFSTHKCRDVLLENDFDTARRGVSKIFGGFIALQKCRTKNAEKEVEKMRF